MTAANVEVQYIRTSECEGCRSEAKYEKRYWDTKQLSPYWQLVAWRVILDGTPGRWHRVNRNNLRSKVAGFEVIRSV